MFVYLIHVAPRTGEDLQGRNKMELSDWKRPARTPHNGTPLVN
jgi:hypothetical protein